MSQVVDGAVVKQYFNKDEEGPACIQSIIVGAFPAARASSVWLWGFWSGFCSMRTDMSIQVIMEKC